MRTLTNVTTPKTLTTFLFVVGIVSVASGGCDKQASKKGGSQATAGQGATSAMTPARRRPGGPLHQQLVRRYVLKGHELGVETLAFSADGKFLASAGYDKTVRVWDLSTGKVKRVLTGHTAWVPSVACHPKDALVASGSGDKTILVQRYNRKTKPIEIREHNGVNAVAFSPDGEFIAAGGFRGGLRLWHVRSGDWRRSFKGHESDVYAVAFSPDGKLLASGSADKTIRLWKVATGKTVRVLTGHTDWVLSLTFSPDGRILRSVGREGALRTWDVATGKDLRTLRVTDKVRAADFSPDGTLIAVSSGRRVKLLEATTGKVLRRFPEQPKKVTAVVFSPDGRSLAWGCNDATIQVWWAAP